MGAQAKNRSTAGSGRAGVGTEATTRRKLLIPPLASPGDPTSPGLTKELALRPGSGIIKTGGCNAGDDVERGTLGSPKSGAPLHSLADCLRALRDAKAAMEYALLRMHVEDRSGLAIALCEVAHVLKGGTL